MLETSQFLGSNTGQTTYIYIKLEEKVKTYSRLFTLSANFNDLVIICQLRVQARKSKTGREVQLIN